MLFNNSLDDTVHNVMRYPDGCYLFMDAELFRKRFTLVNISRVKRQNPVSLFLLPITKYEVLAVRPRFMVLCVGGGGGAYDSLE